LNSKIIENIGTMILASISIILTMIFTAILIKCGKIPLVKKIAELLK